MCLYTLAVECVMVCVLLLYMYDRVWFVVYVCCVCDLLCGVVWFVLCAIV